MTRGTAFLIVETFPENKMEIVNSCEFNGDMYPGGHYEEMMERLNRVNSPADFYKEILDFDKKNFQYQDEKNTYFTFYRSLKDKDFDMCKDCFSDYVFVKNMAKEAIVVSGKKIEPKTTEAFYFGDWISPEEYSEKANRG